MQKHCCFDQVLSVKDLDWKEKLNKVNKNKWDTFYTQEKIYHWNK